MIDWIKGFAGAVTVCDKDGKILEMNEQACKVFVKSGGATLVGSSLLDCHPEPARSKLLQMLENPSVNAYTIEKNGIKKLIYQAPWYEDGQFSGFVEVSLPLPANMPHYIRTPSPEPVSS